MTQRSHPGPPGDRVVVVGNDVIDLLEARLQGKAQDQRFLARVLAPAERRGLEESSERHVELWCLWAAKESAYKAVCKVREQPPVFGHSSFEVCWTRAVESTVSNAAPLRIGRVAFQRSQVPVVVHGDPLSLHAHAWLPADAPGSDEISWGTALLDSPGSAWDAPLGVLLERFSPRERSAVHSARSAAVRLAARQALAESMQVEEGRLELVCDPGPLGRSPPRVYMDGVPAPADVSLSHAGRWLAWALWIPPPGPRQSPFGR